MFKNMDTLEPGKIIFKDLLKFIAKIVKFPKFHQTSH